MITCKMPSTAQDKPYALAIGFVSSTPHLLPTPGAKQGYHLSSPFYE